MNRKILLLSLLMLISLFLTTFWTLPIITALADPEEAEPLYVGVAKYYDDRKCVVTSTHDDLSCNTSFWESCLSMLTEKKIYHTVAIITNASNAYKNDWDYVQYWVDQGYTEAGSHSRNHVHTPYTGNDSNGTPRISYEWQINGSKNDIIGNLTLPNWWRYGNIEYVYAWIEPYGCIDDTGRQWLGDCYYLCDRIAYSGHSYLAEWDPSAGLFNRIGYTVEMGTPPWGGDSSVSSLNSKFNRAYNDGTIYHLMSHPSYVNWSEGSYADQHTDYISNRKDVWYVPFGLLYLYHWVDVRNIVNVTSAGSGLNKVFKLSINATDHLNYGVSYPITYIFDIPSEWTSGYVYYRYLETDPWMLMENKSSQDFFNGICASRFDFSNNKTYVSVGFSNVSNEIYLQLRPKPRNVIGITSVTTLKNIVGQSYILDIYVITVNYGVATETVNVTTYINTTVIQTKNITLTGGDSKNITFTWNTTGVPYGYYTISAYATPVLGETDTTDNTRVYGTVLITISGDITGDGTGALPDGDVDKFDLGDFAEAYRTNATYPNYNSLADFTGDTPGSPPDGDIDMYDLAVFAENYGKKW